MTGVQSKTQTVAEQAALWMVLLTSDDEAERIRAQAGFSCWKSAHTSHAEAAARIEAFIDQVQGVRHGATGKFSPAHTALNAAYEGTRKTRRRLAGKRIGGVLALVAALLLPAWFVIHTQAPAHLLADVRSTNGQWVSRTLSDGTQITLSGVSAVNLRYDERSRTVQLLEGEILVDVAKDASRPFYVETPLARIRALGTRFSVTYDGASSMLEMFDSKVTVQTAAQQLAGNSEALVVSAGQRVRLSPQGVDEIDNIDPDRTEEGWRQHQLVINNRPLPEVLDQLARHRPGWIHYEREQLEHIRVSGVLPLDNPEQALQLLQTNFPQLRMRFLATPWAWIDLKPSS